MPGPPQQCRSPAGQSLWLVEGDDLETVNGGDGVFVCVERQSRLMLGETVPVRVSGVLLLQVARVGQQDPAEFRGRFGAEDRAPEAMLHEEGQIARMVEMGVGQNDGIDLAWINREACPVAKPERLETLEQAAIDEQTMIAALDQELRSGDRPGAAQKRQSQRQLSLVRLEGANHLWRRVPPSELSIELVADGRRGRATGPAEAP